MPKKLDPDLVGKVEDGRLDCHHKCDPLVIARHRFSRLIWMWSIWHLVYVHDALHVHLEGGEAVRAPENGHLVFYGYVVASVHPAVVFGIASINPIELATIKIDMKAESQIRPWKGLLIVLC